MCQWHSSPLPVRGEAQPVHSPASGGMTVRLSASTIILSPFIAMLQLFSANPSMTQAVPAGQISHLSNQVIFFIVMVCSADESEVYTCFALMALPQPPEKSALIVPAYSPSTYTSYCPPSPLVVAK